jgi:hypothetical protein
MRKRALAGIFAFLVCSCVTAAGAGKEPRVLVCDYEAAVGSHIREKVCRYQDEIDEASQEAQRTMMQMNTGGNRSAGQGGGAP